MRTIVALLIAPLILALPWASYALFQSSPLQDRLLEFLVATVMAYSASLTLTVLLALPLFFVFRRFDLVNLWTAVGSGAVIGGIGAMLYSEFLWFTGAWMYVLGGLAGFVFWSIWRPHQARPRLIERLVLSHTTIHWQTSSRVVSLALKDAESLRVIADAETVADQVRKLVMEGRLESRGELRDLRSSEIRDRS